MMDPGDQQELSDNEIDDDRIVVVNRPAGDILGIDFDWNNPATASPLAVLVSAFSKPSRIKQLLESGRSPNAPDNIGVTPLHIASRSDQSNEVLKLLIRYGGYVNHTTHSGVTPLCLAAYTGSSENVKLLIQSGAKLNTKTLIGANAMHYAANGGHLGVIKLLHTAGVDPDVADDYKRRPLSIAAKKGFVDICRYLMENGCSPLRKADEYNTPIHYACQINNVELLNAMVEYVGGNSRSTVNYECPLGWFLTMEAAQRGSTDVLRRLFELGADPEVVNDHGQLALHLSTNRNPKCFLECLKHTPVETINLRSIPGAGAMTSLVCLLTDCGYADCLDALFSKPGLDPAVTTCPIYPFPREPKSPISYVFSIENADAMDDTEQMLRVFMKHKVPVDIKDCTPAVEVLFAFHKNHPSRVDCRCQKFLMMLLDSGCMKTVETELPNNPVLWGLITHAYLSGLVQYINRCSVLSHREVVRQIINVFMETNEGITREILSSMSCLVKISQAGTLTNLCHFVLKDTLSPLKAMAREVVRSNFSRQQVLSFQDVPRDIINYLDFSEFPADTPNFVSAY